MSLTILHISDLHRTPDSRIANSPLVESLVRDSARYTTFEGIGAARIIVVSGDLVQGVGPSVPPHEADATLATQYREARDFLRRLVDEFLDGDYARMVIVPGNHDVSLPHVRRSIRPLTLPTAPKARQELVVALHSPGSLLRWDWESLQFFEIANQDAYAERLRPFAEFYENFYEGHRKYALSEGDQVDLFEYADLNLSFVGFSTMFGGDPINKRAAVNPAAVALASQRLRNCAAAIRIAVFHHGFGGGPGEPDFVHEDFAQQLLDCECTMALHGHTHRTRFFQQRFLLDARRILSTVGAGSLCAGPQALPPAEPRSYNVMELDIAGTKARVHRRVQCNDVYLAPLWGPAPSPRPYATPHEFTMFRCEIALGILRTKRLDLAFASMRSGDAITAIESLRPLLPADEEARSLATEALGRISDPSLTMEILQTPRNLAEAIVMAFALDELGRTMELEEVLNGPFLSRADDPASRDAKAKLETRLAQHKRGTL